MARDLQKTIPEAFSRGGCACQDVLGLLSNYSIERAAKKIDTLTKLLFKATQLPGRPDHIAKLTMQDCQQLLTKIIANAQEGKSAQQRYPSVRNHAGEPIGMLV
ncbi:hypothetical protein [Roseiconus lacunae]|uniref:Uncharacterized protein n=1 Tax=Roseiconus lacunae TaxID=2605694 RepID=A0ABT7PER2_9BACT|nr:hypothetical protein [Roseiconus lacunae]MDM4014984.1 hypothetical protein [Roseiconus lacunae]